MDTASDITDVGATTLVQQAEKSTGDSREYITLKVIAQNGNQTIFRIKRKTQLRKLMKVYCERQAIDLNAIAFLFDGYRLRGEQTPEELKMDDDDKIDAMLQQLGGSLS